MKKAILSTLIVAILATGLKANETVLDSTQPVQAQEVTLESIMAAPDDPNARIIPPGEQATKEEPGVGMKILAAAATPVIIAGAVVTAIVISPVWLVKKALGK